MREIGVEVRNEIVALTKEGKKISEIMEATKVSKGTVQKYQAQAGLRSPGERERGGVISRTIPIGPFADNRKVEEEPDPVLIADQVLTIFGTDTMTSFRGMATKDTVSIEGNNLMGEIKVEDMPKLAKEIMGAYKLIKKMKSNRYGLN